MTAGQRKFVIEAGHIAAPDMSSTSGVWHADRTAIIQAMLVLQTVEDGRYSG